MRILLCALAQIQFFLHEETNQLTLTILNYSETLLIWSPPGNKNLTVLTVTVTTY